MKLHATNWLAATAHLTATEYAVLLKLLMHFCLHDELPIERERLARICRCTLEEFEQAWSAIECWFDVAQDGRLTVPDPCIIHGAPPRVRVSA